MRIHREEFREQALQVISDATEGEVPSCFADPVECLSECTYPLFDPVNRLIHVADHCETFTSLPPWRYDLEDLMVDRWESFCNSVHFFLQVDCYEKVDKEIDLLFEWIKNITAQYTALLDSHTNGSVFREPPF